MKRMLILSRLFMLALGVIGASLASADNPSLRADFNSGTELNGYVSDSGHTFQASGGAAYITGGRVEFKAQCGVPTIASPVDYGHPTEGEFIAIVELDPSIPGQLHFRYAPNQSITITHTGKHEPRIYWGNENILLDSWGPYHIRLNFRSGAQELHVDGILKATSFTAYDTNDLSHTFRIESCGSGTSGYHRHSYLDFLNIEPYNVPVPAPVPAETPDPTPDEWNDPLPGEDGVAIQVLEDRIANLEAQVQTQQSFIDTWQPFLAWLLNLFTY